MVEKSQDYLWTLDCRRYWLWRCFWSWNGRSGRI